MINPTGQEIAGIEIVVADFSGNERKHRRLGTRESAWQASASLKRRDSEYCAARQWVCGAVASGYRFFRKYNFCGSHSGIRSAKRSMVSPCPINSIEFGREIRRNADHSLPGGVDSQAQLINGVRIECRAA